MVKSLSLLAMAGAATAYGNAPRHVFSTPVYPPGPVTPIPPVTTPVYSSTVTERTTYYPSQTDAYGAISTHKVTSTRHFDPSTYNPGPSDACYGGVVILRTEGSVLAYPDVGMAIAKAAAMADVDWKDFTVYEANYNSADMLTSLTTLICNKDVFGKVVKSMHAAPNLWWLSFAAESHHIVYPDAASQELYVHCGGTTATASTFLLYGKCIPCTPLPAQATCAVGETLQCTSPSDSKCAV